MELGGRFWIGTFGAIIGAGLAALILFLLIGWAWAVFGFFGMFLLFAGTLLLIGYLFDRREERRREQFAGE